MQSQAHWVIFPSMRPTSLRSCLSCVYGFQGIGNEIMQFQRLHQVCVPDAAFVRELHQVSVGAESTGAKELHSTQRSPSNQPISFEQHPSWHTPLLAVHHS